MIVRMLDKTQDELLGNYIGTNCPQVEMVGETGKTRKTLAANAEQMLRIIQSIPSPKAARRGGSVAESARKKYELETGKKAVSPINAKRLKQLKSENSND